MKTFFFAVALLCMSSLAFAYEQNGNLGVTWTGYKTEKKAPVSGTFNEINFSVTASKSLSDFLKSATVSIESASLESKNPVRNTNITSTLFMLATAKTITSAIIDVDETNNTLVLKLKMNEVTKEVPMVFSIENNSIIAKGSIDVLDFDMKNPYLAFVKKCAALHANKSFSEVGIAFNLPFK